MANARPSPDDLAEQAAALRRLARGLVRDADVEDVVQDTLVAAWRHPTGPRGGLSTWMRGIARNLARKSHRSRKRRAAREAAIARREGRPPTADVVARIEVQRLVLAEVRRLEDPYRKAIWLRYFENLPPRRIASEMDAPVATVHTWLARGRERLRARLDEAHGGDRRVWVGLLAAWPALPTTAAAVLGALVMKHAVAAVVGLAVLGLVAWYVAAGPFVDRTASSTKPARRQDPEPEGAPLLVGRAESAMPETPLAPEPEPGPSCTHRLVVTLDTEGAWREGLAKVSVLPVRLMHPGDPHGADDAPVEARTNGEPLEMDISRLFGPHDLPMIELEVTVDHPRYMPAGARCKVVEGDRATGDAPHVYRANLRLVAAATLDGLVVDEEGRPVEAASVGVWHALVKKAWNAVELARTDASGHYQLRVARSGPHLVVATAHGLGAAGMEVEVDSDGVPVMEDLVLERGRVVKGVLRINGEPVPGALVTAGLTNPRRTVYEAYALGPERVTLTYLGRAFPGWPRASVVRMGTCWCNQRPYAVTDEHGRFELAGCAPGPYVVRVDRRTALGFIHRDLEEDLSLHIEPGASDVELDIEAHVLRVEVTSDGEPLEQAWARVKASGAFGGVAGPFRTRPEDGLISPVLVRPEARYRISATAQDHARAERWITSGAAREGSVESLALSRTRTEDGTVAPPEGRVQVRVDASDGSTVTRCGFELRTKGEWPLRIRRDLESEDGLFQLERIPPGIYTLQAHAGGTVWGGEGFWTLAECEIEVSDGRTSGMVLKAEPGGRVRFKVLDPDRRPITARCTIRDAQGAKVPALYVSRSSRACSRGGSIGAGAAPTEVDRALPPGTYTFHVRTWHLIGRPPAAETTVEVEVEAGEVTEFEVVLPVE